MNYYQLHPSDEPVIQTLATVIKFYGWSRISIITEVEKRFLNVSTSGTYKECNINLGPLLLITIMSETMTLECEYYYVNHQIRFNLLININYTSYKVTFL